MPKDLKLHEDTCRIRYVSESKTRGTWAHPDGRRRFVIGAEKLAGESLGERHLSFSTLDAWSASLCDQAWKQGFPVRVKYRFTRYFDAALLYVEKVQTEREVGV